ncbi:S41 family peptidase [Carboxylicivirga sp. RSCT41]|uniref:S41 family peptidase n=1 Tax=Carboxylicivirga agarovorans TaxID=3417570 RepID=UPI003D32C1E3
MNKLLLTAIFLIPVSLFSQSNYNNLFLESIELLERNYIGYKYIKSNKMSHYGYFKSNLTSDTLTSKGDLINALAKYISFFEDKHLYLSTKNYYEPSKSSENGFQSKFLNSNTYYLRIPSFNNLKAINSVLNYAIQTDSMFQVENLIIDIRNNSGGKNKYYRRLLPIVATNEIYTRKYELLATKENWESHMTRNNMPNISDNVEGLIVDAPWQNHDGKYVLEYKPSGINELPKRVAILINRNTASSAEKFVECAKQSFKVKTFGENTCGAVDFGDIISSEIIKDSLYIVYPTTNVFDFKVNGVDSKGIAPDFYLDSENQVDQVLKYFKVWH